MQTEALAPTDFADAIREAHRVAIAHGKRAFENLVASKAAILDCGNYLIQQKALLHHGAWLPWCKAHLPDLHERTINNYMRFAVEYQRRCSNPNHDSDLPSHLPSMRQWYVELGILRSPDARDQAASQQSFLAPIYRLLGSKEFRGLLAADVDHYAADEREMLRASLKPIVEFYERL